MIPAARQTNCKMASTALAALAFAAGAMNVGEGLFALLCQPWMQGSALSQWTLPHCKTYRTIHLRFCPASKCWPSMGLFRGKLAVLSTIPLRTAFVAGKLRGRITVCLENAEVSQDHLCKTFHLLRPSLYRLFSLRGSVCLSDTSPADDMYSPDLGNNG